MPDMAALDNRALKLIDGALQHLPESQQDEERLETLKQAIDCLPLQTGITICDVHGRIVYANSVQASMHGYAAGELLGRDVRSLSAADPQLPQIGIASDCCWNREAVSLRKNGSAFPVLVSSMPVHDSQGRCIAVVTACEDITGQKDSERQIELLAYYDAVTDLPNRALLLDRLQQAITEGGAEVALLMLDLDNFKDLNDTKGHDLGDRLLRELASRLCGAVSRGLVARLGGDEFVVLLKGAREEQAAAAASAMHAVFEEPFLLEELGFYSSASIGIALYPGDGADAEGLLRSADAAMYHAKSEGRGNSQFFSVEMNERLMRRVALETSIRQGLARGEFTVHYQPQWDLKEDRLTGVEALLRWNSADLGTVSPSEFIPVAEASGAILELGEMVLQQACLQARSWGERGAPLKVAVNISGRQFGHPCFLETVARVVRETGVCPSLLDLELTESVIMEKAERNIGSLRALKEMGVQLTIDDFGTGYSSLSYLKHFPIDVIKIDRSFISEVERNTDDAAITEAIISMAHSLKLQVVAEGVENGAQLSFLRKRGCDGAQGYYLATPMPEQELTELLGEIHHVDPSPRPSELRAAAGLYAACSTAKQ